MKIGDEVYIHGYIDEIRKDTIIIKNDGGYFGTVQEEISVNPQKSGKWIERKNIPKSVDVATANLRWKYWCSECGYEVRLKYHYCPNCGARMRGAE